MHNIWYVYFGSNALASSLFQPIFISFPSLISRFDDEFGTFRINSGLPKRLILTLARVRINLLGNPEFILKVPNSSSNLDIKLGNEIKIGWNSEDARALDPK